MEVILTGENSMDVQVGDSIITKKPHPCGNSTFAVPVSYTHLTLPTTPYV